MSQAPCEKTVNILACCDFCEGKCCYTWGLVWRISVHVPAAHMEPVAWMHTTTWHRKIAKITVFRIMMNFIALPTEWNTAVIVCLQTSHTGKKD